MKYITLTGVDYYLKNINLKITKLSLNIDDILNLINYIEELDNLLTKEYNSNKQYNISRKKITILSDCLEHIIEDLCELCSIIKTGNSNLKHGDLNLNGFSELLTIQSKSYLEPYKKWIEKQHLETRKKNSEYRRLRRRNNNLAITPREIDTIKRFILCNYWKKQGLRNFQIAERLNISTKTVKNHLDNIHEIDMDNDLIKEFAIETIRNEEEKYFDFTLQDDELTLDNY